MATKPKLSPSEVAFWLREIKSCEERQKHDLIVRNNYPFLIRYYEGRQSSAIHNPHRHSQNTVKMAIINEYFPNINSLISTIMFQNPDILVQATKPFASGTDPLTGLPTQLDVEGNEDTIKGALTHLFKETEALIENRLALFDMLVAGYCGVEVNQIQVSEKELQPGVDKKPQENFFSRAVNGIRNKMLGEEEQERKLEEGIPPREFRYASHDKTVIRRWNPLNILLDYRAERLKDMRYLIKKTVMSHAEFLAMYPDFEGKVAADTADNVIPFTSHHHHDSVKKAMTVYQIQVRKLNGKYENIILTPSAKERELDFFVRPYTTNGFDVKIGTLHKYGVLYPISFAQVNKGLQDDINNYVTHEMEVAERNIPKRGVNKNKKVDTSALNSRVYNDVVECDGGAESVWEMPMTNVSRENKELLGLFQNQNDKGWGVSESRTAGGKANVKFAEELKIQEAGFQNRQIDIQEGLRSLIKDELNTAKDIIATFWDDEKFIKITGGQKPSWYVPEVRGGQVINPLNELLTADYEVDVDISTALRPNKERLKQDTIEFLTWATDPNRLAYLASQGVTVNPNEIKRVSKEFGFNSEQFLIPFQPPPEEASVTGPQGGGVSVQQPSVV